MLKILELGPVEDIKGEELKNARIRLHNRALDLEIEEKKLKKRVSNIILSNTEASKIGETVKILQEYDKKMSAEEFFTTASQLGFDVGKALRKDLIKYDRGLQKLVQSMSRIPL